MTDAVLDWARAAGESDTFVGTGAALVGIAGFFLFLGLHGESFHRGGVPESVAYPGALVAGLLAVALLTALIVGYPAIKRRGSGLSRVAVSLTSAVILFFAILPVAVSGQRLLTIFLFALVTVVYDAIAAAYLAIVRPWEALRRDTQ